MSAYEYTDFSVWLQYLMDTELSPILPPPDNEVPSEKKEKEKELNNDQRINYILCRTKEMVIDFARSCGCDGGKLISISESISERAEEKMDKGLEGSDATNADDNNMSFVRESPETPAFDIQRFVETMVTVPSPAEPAIDSFHHSNVANRLDAMPSPVDIQMLSPRPDSPNSSTSSLELADTKYNTTLDFPLTSTPYYRGPIVPVVPMMSPMYPALISPVYPVHTTAHSFTASPVFPMPMGFSPVYPGPVYPMFPHLYPTVFHQ
ncbi:hypothetical protein L5515_012211 [Caenorhabditis briggsae]|uniref:Uncharacterized protein n=1 Tax=Caenorhabditis briggsae TaxID=6238 RepID=A0AAE9EXY4_CAEBR|nr:hypothetical protein L5515_012211 [Caenorhabditis briggsae]